MKRVYFDTNIFEDIVKKVIDINIDELNSFTNIAYYISKIVRNDITRVVWEIS